MFPFKPNDVLLPYIGNKSFIKRLSFTDRTVPDEINIIVELGTKRNTILKEWRPMRTIYGILITVCQSDKSRKRQNMEISLAQT